MNSKGQRKQKTKEATKPEPQPRVSAIVRFSVTYLITMGALFLVIGLKSVQDIIDINGLYTSGVMIATSKVLGILGIPCSHQDSIIRLPRIALDVKFGCNGLEAVMIYSVAVIAFPSSWNKKIIGMLVGFMVIQAVNILRIAALAYSGIHFRGLFEVIHLYVAQGIMIAISLGLFFLYLAYANKEVST